MKPTPLQSMDALKSHVQQRRAAEAETRRYSDRVLKRLQTGDGSDLQAQFLANILAELDDVLTYDPLTLQWTLDHYIANVFERRAYPLFQQIWNTLRERGHTFRNKFSYFNDNEAFYIPCDGKSVTVFGKSWRDEIQYLSIDVIQDFGSINWQDFYVRRIWGRRRLDCIGSIDRPTLSFYRCRDFDLKFNDDERVIYGDCRDPGHVLTYRHHFEGDGQCDHVIWDLGAPLHWFFEVQHLWNELHPTPRSPS